jgi:hypothetical protein
MAFEYPWPARSLLFAENQKWRHLIGGFGDIISKISPASIPVSETPKQKRKNFMRHRVFC